MKKEKYSLLQVVLTVISVSAMLISTILANKSINFFSQCAAIIVLPITYILSDIFSEVYGYKWSRISCYLAFGANIFLAIALKLSMIIPADPTWFNTEEAWANTLNVSYITLASLIAFVAGDFINDKVFRHMQENPQNKFGVRAIVSSFFGELVDSIIFTPLAFGLLPVIFNEPWMIISIDTMISRIFFATVFKVLYEIIILPLTTYLVKVVKKQEGMA